MKNLITTMKDELEVEGHESHKGKMPRRNKSRIKKDGRLISQLKRASLKMGKTPTFKSLYGKQGHSSWWD